jgi:hypothetical protein
MWLRAGGPRLGDIGIGRLAARAAGPGPDSDLETDTDSPGPEPHAHVPVTHFAGTLKFGERPERREESPGRLQFLNLKCHGARRQ